MPVRARIAKHLTGFFSCLHEMLLEPDEGRGSASSGGIADLRFAVSCASTSITLSRISRSSAAVNPPGASAEDNRPTGWDV
jgi:hypothetical protein